MLSHYVRLCKVKAMLDSDIDSIADMREDSIVFQPRNPTENPNVKETGTPRNKTVGVDVKEPSELRNNFPERTGQIIEHRTDWETPHGRIAWVVPEVFLNETDK